MLIVDKSVHTFCVNIRTFTPCTSNTLSTPPTCICGGKGINIEDANKGYQELGFDCRLARILDHLPDTERRKILRYRQSDDSLRGACCAALIRALWGRFANSRTKCSVEGAMEAPMCRTTLSAEAGVSPQDRNACVLCAGRCIKDEQGRPRWCGMCPHTQPSASSAPACSTEVGADAAALHRTHTETNSVAALLGKATRGDTWRVGSAVSHVGCACTTDVNGSHHGEWVAAAAVPQGRVGVDLTHSLPPHARTPAQAQLFMQRMWSVLGPHEQADVAAAILKHDSASATSPLASVNGSATAAVVSSGAAGVALPSAGEFVRGVRAFGGLWGAKEAWVKALGDGLVCAPQHVEVVRVKEERSHEVNSKRICGGARLCHAYLEQADVRKGVAKGVADKTESNLVENGHDCTGGCGVMSAYQPGGDSSIAEGDGAVCRCDGEDDAKNATSADGDELLHAGQVQLRVAADAEPVLQRHWARWAARLRKSEEPCVDGVGRTCSMCMWRLNQRHDRDSGEYSAARHEAIEAKTSEDTSFSLVKATDTQSTTEAITPAPGWCPMCRATWWRQWTLQQLCVDETHVLTVVTEPHIGWGGRGCVPSVDDCDGEPQREESCCGDAAVSNGRARTSKVYGAGDVHPANCDTEQAYHAALAPFVNNSRCIARGKEGGAANVFVMDVETLFALVLPVAEVYATVSMETISGLARE